MRIILSVLWLVAAGTGFAWILNYQNSSGGAGPAPEHWPLGTQITLNSKEDTLVMFAHPQCPCTEASLEELNRLLARSGGSVAAQVWFFKPDSFSNDWAHSDLWKSAAAIPGVTVREDVNGAQARLFGAETSGYVLLFDTHGRLLFKGGITGSRGHAGDNAGENAIIAWSNGQAAGLDKTPVYGCSLLGKCEVPTKGLAK
ncbi:MAG TPA: hypothetical protein VNZ25_01575 [Candidatus Angelobacter sp.]|nr:hypothetical protein [Candidatus Angelobacter sp.]